MRDVHESPYFQNIYILSAVCLKLFDLLITERNRSHQFQQLGNGESSILFFLLFLCCKVKHQSTVTLNDTNKETVLVCVHTSIYLFSFICRLSFLFVPPIILKVIAVISRCRFWAMSQILSPSLGIRKLG